MMINMVSPFVVFVSLIMLGMIVSVIGILFNSKFVYMSEDWSNTTLKILTTIKYLVTLTYIVLLCYVTYQLIEQVVL